MSSTSCPPYFPLHVVSGKEKIDGGIRNNNISKEIVQIVKDLRISIDVLTSFGTGETLKGHDCRGFSISFTNEINKLLDVVVQSQSPHSELVGSMERGRYFRLSPVFPSEIGLSDVSKFQELEDAAKQLLDNHQIHEYLAKMCCMHVSCLFFVIIPSNWCVGEKASLVVVSKIVNDNVKDLLKSVKFNVEVSDRNNHVFFIKKSVSLNEKLCFDLPGESGEFRVSVKAQTKTLCLDKSLIEDTPELFPVSGCPFKLEVRDSKSNLDNKTKNVFFKDVNTFKKRELM